MEKALDKIFLEQYYYDKTQKTINEQYCKLRKCLQTGKPEGKGKDVARAYKLWYECNSFDYNPDFEKDEFYTGDFSNIRISYNDIELKKIKKENNDFALLPPEQPEKQEEIIVKKKKKKNKNKQIIKKTPEKVLAPEQPKKLTEEQIKYNKQSEHFQKQLKNVNEKYGVLQEKVDILKTNISKKENDIIKIKKDYKDACHQRNKLDLMNEKSKKDLEDEYQRYKKFYEENIEKIEKINFT